MKNKCLFKLIMAATMCATSLILSAQQTPAAPDAANPRFTLSDVPAVEPQFKGINEKLHLNVDQQTKVKASLQELHDASEKLVTNQSLTRGEVLEKVGPLRLKAHDQICATLTDGQKAMLEDYLRSPHPELHGGLTAAVTTSSQPQR